MTDRPMVNVYELDENGAEKLVYREMNAKEFKQRKRDEKDAMARRKAEDERPHPLVEQVRDMSDEDRQQLRELLREV